jgi:hypothetical protein
LTNLVRPIKGNLCGDIGVPQTNSTFKPFTFQVTIALGKNAEQLAAEQPSGSTFFLGVISTVHPIESDNKHVSR